MQKVRSYSYALQLLANQVHRRSKQALSGSRGNGGGEVLEAENQRFKQLIGELTIANDAFKKFWKERKEDGSRRSTQ